MKLSAFPIGSVFTCPNNVDTRQVLISKRGANENYPNICAWVDPTGKVEAGAYSNNGFLHNHSESSFFKISPVRAES